MNYFTTTYSFNMPTKIAIVFFAIIAFVGIWFFLSAFLPRPSKKTRQTLALFNKRNKQKNSTAKFDTGLNTLAQKFAKYIRLNDIERSELQQALQITNNPLSPEEYKAICFLSGGIFILFGGVLLILGLVLGISLCNILGVGGMVLGIFYYFYLNRAIRRDKEDVVEGVDKELPRFVSFMNTALQKQNTSVLAILERYTPHNERFTVELEQTIADAKTSNFSGAMARWDQRMNSDRLKRVVRGLINANNGDDVRVYFAMLERDFNAYEMVMLKQNIKRIPERMRLPKMLMYSSVALSLFFPIIMQVVESFSMFFSQ